MVLMKLLQLEFVYLLLSLYEILARFRRPPHSQILSNRGFKFISFATCAIIAS